MTQIQLRRGTASAWTSADPILALGEVGIETNTLKSKVGDGTSTWSELDYMVTAWADVTGKPAVIGAGATKADARAAIDAASLDGSGLVPSSQLPSYVDDVLEYANSAAFPGTGETGKIYIALDTGRSWRWSGSTYVQIVASPGTTDAITEGSTNLFYTNARADGRISAAVGVSVQAYDADLTAFAGKTAPTGAVVGDTDTQTLTNKDISSATNTFPSSLVTLTGTQTLTNKALTSPTLTTPVLGTPSSGNVSSCLGQVADLSMVAFGANTTRAAGTGDFPFGVKLQRAITFSSVTYRVSTADASGNLVVELRKNGSAVSGTSATIAAASQVAGGTVTGTWAFAAGDIVTVQITGVGTTPGKGLVADVKGLTA